MTDTSDDEHTTDSTHTTDEGTDDSPTADGGGAASDAAPTEEVPDESATDDDGGRSTLHYLQWAAFGTLALLAVVATIQVYFAASRTISIWISPDYRPIFQAGFNLVVLAVCGVGLSLLARRLR